MKTPFLGTAYYPEDWDESQVAYDIGMMKKAGISCARIAEFSWRAMESRPGEYDFGWLHRVVDALREAGIGVVMGTPTATPPVWFWRAHPEAAVLSASGERANHGGRRHFCSNNPDYIRACRTIVEKLGQEFGRDPAIIGWQIDNEIYHSDNTSCVCPDCVRRFHDRLRREYGDAEGVNRRWDLNLFSQAYDDIEEIPAPIHAWHNPHILYEWDMAHEEADVEFITMQADILRKYTDAPIGTDMMPMLGIDFEAMNEKLDVVQFNHYNPEGNLDAPILFFDMLRTVRPSRFWNTETAPQWPGSTAAAWAMQGEGFCRVNSWLPVALGGEANMYWLWRQHWAGHELLHGHVLSPEGRPSHVFGEIRQTADDFAKASDFLSGTTPDTQVALHFTSKSWKLFRLQSVFNGHNYEYDVRSVDTALHRMGVTPDVLGARHSLDGYKVLVSPEVFSLEDAGLNDRIRAFVENGGVWVAGPLTDVRNSIGAHYTDRAMGMVEELTGARLDYSICNDNRHLKAAFTDGTPVSMRTWVECFTLPENAEVIASITEGYSALVGKAVCARIPVGKGQVILCGVIAEGDTLRRILGTALDLAGIRQYKTTGALTVVPRAGEAGNGLVLTEIAGQPASIELDKAMTDILTGRTVGGHLDVAPYEVLVLR